MYVHEYMHRNVITINSKARLCNAEQLMLEKGIRRLPVVDREKLVGLLTRGRIREELGCQIAQPKETSENEIEDTKVEDLMETQLCTVNPYAPVEWAVTKAQMWNVGTILVVSETDHSQLLGILTTTDLYKLLCEALGFGDPGIRLHIFDPNRADGCREVLRLIIDQGLGIKNMYHVRPPALDKEDCIVHLDTENAADTVAKLRERGYEVEIRQC